jgi:hypothetical protein
MAAIRTSSLFPCIRCLLLPAVVLAALAGAAGAATFSDAAFVPADWSTTVEVLNLGGSVTTSQVTSGGNPGMFRRVDNGLASAIGQPFSNSVFGFHARAGALYDTSGQGVISAIDYSEDAFRFSGSGVQANGIALRQGGVIYYGPASLTPATPGVWQPYSWTHLTALDFDALAPGVQHPDFSTTGPMIEFGFYRSNSTSVGGDGGTVSGGIDNWRVILLTPVAAERGSWGRLKMLYGR